MDPNNNQPLNTNPFGQLAGMPVQQSSPLPIVEPVAPAPMYPAPKGGSKKGIILLLLLLILALGMGFYVFFVKNQINSIQKNSAGNSTNIIPPPAITPVPTPATVEEINVASPDAELNGIQTDVQGL